MSRQYKTHVIPLPHAKGRERRKFGAPEGVLVDPEDEHLLRSHCWRILSSGYVVTFLTKDGKQQAFLLHRVILGEATRGFEVDHANGNRLDNRRENLRVATRSFNGQNRHKRKTGTTSRYRNVSWDKVNRKWVVRIRLPDGVAYNLGRFVTEEEANRVATDFRLKHMAGATS